MYAVTNEIFQEILLSTLRNMHGILLENIDYISAVVLYSECVYFVQRWELVLRTFSSIYPVILFVNHFFVLVLFL